MWTLGSDLLIRSLPRQFSRALDMGCGYGPGGPEPGGRLPRRAGGALGYQRPGGALSAQNAWGQPPGQCPGGPGDLFAAVTGDFDLIATNPPIRTGKRNIYALFAQARERLRPGGALYVVIRKQQGAASAKGRAGSDLRRLRDHCPGIGLPCAQSGAGKRRLSFHSML